MPHARGHHRAAPRLPTHKAYPLLAALRVKVAAVLGRSDTAAADRHYPCPASAVLADAALLDDAPAGDGEDLGAYHALDAAGLVAECDESGEPRYVLPARDAREARRAPAPVLRPRGAFA